MEHLRGPMLDATMKLFDGARMLVKQEDHLEEDNLVISPFSISAGVASMLYYGADGSSLEGLEQELGYRNLFSGHSNALDVLMAFREAILHLTKASKYAGKEHGRHDIIAREFEFVFLHSIYIQRDLPIDPGFLAGIKKYLYVSTFHYEYMVNIKRSRNASFERRN